MAPKRLDPISILCKNERKNTNSKIGNPIIFSKDLNHTMERVKFNNTPEALLKRVIHRGDPDFYELDVYNLNGMFGVPREIHDLQKKNL